MLDEISLQRLIKNIVQAINANDSSLLTVKSVRWILAHWDLKPRLDDILPRGFVWPDARITKAELEPFFKSFNCFEHFVSDVDLDYHLGIINHYVTKDGITDNNRLWVMEFRQRCYVVNEVRKRIGLKSFNIHYVYKRHKHFYPTHQWSYEKSVMLYYGRNLNEAVRRFREAHRDDSHPHFKSYFWFVKKVKQVKDTAPFMIVSSHVHRDVFAALC